MASRLSILGLIPARGGSKSIFKKNIAMLLGKPLIAYTIECARKAGSIDMVVVSTDSPEIADISRKCGGEVPFMRPDALAGDAAPALPVIIHALDNLQKSFDAVMLLQPTSPLRLPEDIDAAIKMLESDAGADSVISVVKVDDHHPARMKQIVDGVLIDPPFAEAMEGQRRQDLPEYYLRNGAIYLTRVSVLRQQKSLKGRRSLAYIMPADRSVNIDSPLDLLLAETILRTGYKEI